MAARKTEVYLARARFFTAERRRLKKGNKNILSEEDNLLIKKLYLQAKHLSSMTNTVWEVDHIFPLKSHFMCGFHHPSNMQIIDHVTNNSKNNYLGKGLCLSCCYLCLKYTNTRERRELDSHLSLEEGGKAL